MVCIFQDELERSIPAEAPYPEVEPVLGGAVEADVRVSLDFQSQRGERCNCCSCDVAAGEAAVNHYRSSDLDVGPVGVPAHRLLALTSDGTSVIIMHYRIKFIPRCNRKHKRQLLPRSPAAYNLIFKHNDECPGQENERSGPQENRAHQPR